MSRLLNIEGLSVDYSQRGWGQPALRAVDDVNLQVGSHETVGLVGESGSGKSTIGRAVLGLVPVASGRLEYAGQDITNRSRQDRQKLSRELQVVFQDPYSSLNAARTVQQSIAEALANEDRRSRRLAEARVRELLDKVGLPPDAAHRYPNAFSGGQRQRIVIARALAASPRLVVCDEPVSALDLSTQGQILNLLADLQEEFDMAFLFIGHDLSVVRHLARRIVVLYRGRIMEEGPAIEVVDQPLHPYTRALVAAAPVADPSRQRERRAERRRSVSATTVAVEAPPARACPFAPRCPDAEQVCWTQRPRPTVALGATVSCHMYDSTSGHTKTVRATG